eukprot:11618223-Ditylum_brightwellii.AAC.2
MEEESKEIHKVTLESYEVDLAPIQDNKVISGTLELIQKSYATLKIFKAQYSMVDSGKGIDWGTAESMAFGSLLFEGNHVHTTGQDV